MLDALLDGDRGLADVAPRLRFANHARLNRMVRGEFGTTPSALRAVLRRAPVCWRDLPRTGRAAPVRRFNRPDRPLWQWSSEGRNFYAQSVDRTQSYVERLPVPGLAGRVRTVWVQSTGPRPYLQRNLPTGGVELHCPIGGLPRLVGPLTAADVQVMPARTTVVGARFWPGAASPLLGVPADRLVGLTVQVDVLWGGAAAQLGELLACAPGADAALERLQHFLFNRQARNDDPDPLVREAVRRLMPWQPVEVGSLSTRLGISASQLRRRLLSNVGVGPKSLQRTLRFQGYLALAQAASSPSGPMPRGRLADLAAEAGYADHAHLSRECLRLTGLAPRELLSGGLDQCGCGHDHAASYLPFLAGRTALLRTV